MDQETLPLRERHGWGGRRVGAGRKPAAKARIQHRSREAFASRLPCLVTLKLRSGLPSLRTAHLVRALEDSFASLREQRRDFRIVHYSLQGDHAHLLVETRDRYALGRGMKALGARIARAVNRVHRRAGRVLADRYHVRVLRTPREVRNALRYVLLNARKHARRASIRRVRVDPAWSGRWFDGWRRPNPGREPGISPVAAARTRLLTVGWRRHGLIDPADVPGGT